MKDISNNLMSITQHWYSLANKIKYTYGLSELVQVNNLISICNQYVLVINVFDNLVAQALRKVIPLTAVIGNTTINMVLFNNDCVEMAISNQSYTPETLSELFNTALTKNPLFKNVVITGGLVTDAI